MRLKQLPKLPTVVYAPGGPIPVVRKADLKDEADPRDGVVVGDPDEPLDGLWVGSKRVIYLDSSLEHRAAWWILLHEKAHAWFDDIGIRFENEEHMEVATNALAAALMAEFVERL